MTTFTAETSAICCFCHQPAEWEGRLSDRLSDTLWKCRPCGAQFFAEPREPEVSTSGSAPAEKLACDCCATQDEFAKRHYVDTMYATPKSPVELANHRGFDTCWCQPAWLPPRDDCPHADKPEVSIPLDWTIRHTGFGWYLPQLVHAETKEVYALADTSIMRDNKIEAREAAVAEARKTLEAYQAGEGLPKSWHYSDFAAEITARKEA